MSSSSLPPPNPDETIHRILFLSPTVHIYTVPPLTSTKGYTTTNWSPLLAPTSTPTTPTTAITTRLRVLETSSPTSPSPSLSSHNPSSSTSSNEHNTIQTTILLEDPHSGALFAAAPYTSPQTVEPVLDSARFFALTVQGEGEEGGRKKAVLGIGFEERSEAIDFGICLQGVRKVLGFDKITEGGVGKGGRRGGGGGGGGGGGEGAMKKEVMGKKDWGLKEGEMIKVEIGGMGVKRKERVGDAEDGEKALFSIQPPPRNQTMGGMPLVPPPPSAEELKAERRRSRGPVMIPEQSSAADLGFDDGEFGEFQ